MKFIKSVFFLPFVLALSSCMGDSDEPSTDKEWRDSNTKFIEEAQAEMIDGKPKFAKIIPDWDNTVFALVQWHRRGSGSLNPLDNSTVEVKYLLTDIKGDTLDSSYSMPDSLYRCRPNGMVTGFWLTLTNMVQGDSVTAIIPYNSGYGAANYGKVKGYSTLVFNISLDSIVAYETLPWRN